MNLNITIISDDVLFPHLFLILLKRKMMNVNITICKSIREINEKVDSTTCKLILLDGGTTSISSIELIQYIRTTKLIVAPVWFFTEIVTPSYILKAKQLGVSLIVNKPFDPHKITDEIATLPFQ